MISFPFLAAVLALLPSSASEHAGSSIGCNVSDVNSWLQSNVQLNVQPGQRLTTQSAIPIPFFIYEEGIAGLTTGCLNNTQWLQDANMFPDWALHQLLKKHPWRVSDPDEAKIFFVPAYMSAAIHRPDRNEGQCGDPEVLFQNLASYLRSSKYFQKNHGRDHLISSFNFPAKGAWVGDMKELLEVMNVVHVYGDSNVGGVLDNNPDLAGLPHGIFAPYGDVLDRLSQTSIASGHTDFWERQTQLFFMGEADNRDAYKDRRIAFTQLAGLPNSTLICVWECSSLQLPACSESHELNGCHQAGSLTEYVKHLRQSRFGLFLRGDTDDSGRLYDYIAAGVVPVIVTSDAQYQNKTKGGFEHRAAPFWSDLPWSEFAFFFPESSFRDDPRAAMNYVLQSSEELIRHKVNGLGEVRRALDWLPDDEGGTKVPSLILRETLRNMGEYVSPVDFLELPSAFFASEDLEALRAHRVDSL